MKDYKQLLKELPSSTIVCALGEFDPPTVGHELLVKTVKRLAEEKKSAYVIYTQPAKNGILQEDKKAQYLSLMFPKTEFKSLDESFSVTLSNLKKKYKNVIVVAGTDQMSSMKRGLKESIQFVALTEKDPDANETKMKSFATKALYEQFKEKLPTSIRDIDGKRLMNDVRQGMGLEPIKEQINLVKDELREQYFRGEIFNVGQMVESNGKQYEIVKRGSNHLLLKEESGELVSKWITDVKEVTEGVIQQNGTDQIQPNGPEKDSKEENGNSMTKPNGVKKGFLTFYGYTKDKTTGDASRGNDVASSGSGNHTGSLRQEEFVVEESGAFEKAEENKRSADAAKKQGDMFAHHLHMADHHDNLAQWHSEKGRHNIADQHAEKAEKHHELAMNLKEEVEELDERNKENATKRKMMDASRGARFKLNNPVPEADPEHKTAQAHNKAIGRALRNEEALIETALNPLDPHGDYKAKTKALQDIQMDPHTHKDPQLKAELVRSKAALEKEYDKYRVKEGNGYDDNRTGFAKRKREDDEYHNEPKPKFKPRAMSDYPHSVHIDGKHWKTFSNGNQARAAARTLEAKGKKTHVIGHFREETEEQKKDREEQLKRFKKQAEGSLPTQDRPGISTENNPTNDPFFKEEVTEQEIDQLVESVTFDDIFDLYEEEELALVYEDTGEEIPASPEEAQIDLMEVLSRQERLKAKIRFRKTAAKRERSTKIALKRYSPVKTINSRARRLAVRLMKQRLLRGRSYDSVSVGEKERIDNMISKRKATIDRIAAKLVSRIRKTEKNRMSHDKVTQTQTNPSLF